MLCMIMHIRNMKEEDIVPAIITGKLPTNRGPVDNYKQLVPLHEQLIERMASEGSAYRAWKLQHKKDNFLYYDSRKRGRGHEMDGPDDEQSNTLILKTKNREDLVYHAHAYATGHLHQHEPPLILNSAAPWLQVLQAPLANSDTGRPQA